MSLLLHLIIAAGYVSVAVAVAISLPQTAFAADQGTANLIGAIGALATALLHQAIAHHQHVRRLSVAEKRQKTLLADFREVRSEVQRLQKGFGEADPEVLRMILSRSADDVASELRVLEILRRQLSGEPEDEPGDEIDAVASDAAASDAAASDGEAYEVFDDEAAAPEDVSDFRADFAAGEGPAASAGHGFEILEATREALKESRVGIYLQPVVTLPERKVEFYESYSRILAEDGSTLGPDDYLPIAEQAGLVSAIDNNLLFRCIQLVRKTRRNNRDYGFFCNISPHTLRDESFFPQFIEFMEENHELADSLIFEFSQEDVANHGADVIEHLNALTALGFGFSMDQVESLDFDFAALAGRHFNYVKIEAGTLLSLVQEDEGGFALESLRRALKRAGIELIVEKVETEQVLVELLDYAIPYGQGYLFGEPRLSRSAA
ncbi:MAG: EAL domain-containing protein [Alphaproteobacteria bacterium]